VVLSAEVKLQILPYGIGQMATASALSIERIVFVVFASSVNLILPRSFVSEAKGAAPREPLRRKNTKKHFEQKITARRSRNHKGRGVGVAARVTGRVALLRDRRCTFIALSLIHI